MNTNHATVLVEGLERPTTMATGALCFSATASVTTAMREDPAIPRKMLKATLDGTVDPGTYMDFLIQSGIPVVELKPRMAYVLLRLGAPRIEITVAG